MWDLPGWETEPMFPALAGGFLATGLPGKPNYSLKYSSVSNFNLTGCIKKVEVTHCYQINTGKAPNLGPTVSLPCTVPGEAVHVLSWQLWTWPSTIQVSLYEIRKQERLHVNNSSWMSLWANNKKGTKPNQLWSPLPQTAVTLSPRFTTLALKFHKCFYIFRTYL